MPLVQKLAADGELTVRIAYNLFTQKPKEELKDFANWSTQVKPGDGDDSYRHNGAGEMLVYSAADFEDFYATAIARHARSKAAG